jgi:hypothetical protein
MSGLDNALTVRFDILKYTEKNITDKNAISFNVTQSADGEDFVLTTDVAEITPEIEGYETEMAGNGFTFKFKKDGAYLTAADGQAIGKRSYLLPPRKILSSRSAVAEIISEANRNLVPQKETAPAFILTTDPTAFSSSAKCAFTVNDNIDLNERYKKTDIADVLADFYNEVTDGQSAKLTAESRRVLPNGAEMPLFMQLPKVFDAETLAKKFKQKIVDFGNTIPEALKTDKFTFRFNFRFEDLLDITHVYAAVKF